MMRRTEDVSQMVENLLFLEPALTCKLLGASFFLVGSFDLIWTRWLVAELLVSKQVGRSNVLLGRASELKACFEVVAWSACRKVGRLAWHFGRLS
jgi:hypothetical protein